MNRSRRRGAGFTIIEMLVATLTGTMMCVEGRGLGD